jgi:PAS domain S-box-containing protein
MTKERETSAERMVMAMRETAARLNGIIASAMDAIITVDQHQNIIIFNPAAETMFGCSAANVLGTPLDQFMPVRFRDAHAAHIDRFSATGVTTRRMGNQAKIVALRASGEEFPVEASISQTEVGGKKLFSVILRDISQREQYEAALKDSAERYQRLVELVPDAIWVEREGRLAFVNRACLQLLGAQTITQVLGRSLFDFIHPEYHGLAIERRSRLLSEPQRNAYVEKKVVTIGAELKFVEVAETSFQDEGAIAVLAVLRDITRRKVAEQELKDSRERLRALSAALHAAREDEQARIARELHDELGQTLTAMKMDVTAILNTRPPLDEAVLSRANDIAGLIETTVAAVRRIATQLRPLMLDDLGLIPTIGWLAREFSKRTGIAANVELPDEDPAIDRDGSTLCYRVLQESLTNIARHSGARNVRIALEHRGTQMRVLVVDDGRGFDVEAARHARRYGLLGMRERAEMAGGRLNIESAPGAGTTIEMIVPLPRGKAS